MNITTTLAIIGAATVANALMRIFDWMERRGKRN
jgi:hypothetical protein